MKKHGSRGFTLVEMMIVLAILGVVGAIIVFGIRGAVSGDTVEQDAEAEARVWASKLGLKVDGIACGDIQGRRGLVSCTVRSGTTTYALECIGRYSQGHGCREQKLSIPQRTTDQP